MLEFQSAIPGATEGVGCCEDIQTDPLKVLYAGLSSNLPLVPHGKSVISNGHSTGLLIFALAEVCRGLIQPLACLWQSGAGLAAPLRFPTSSRAALALRGPRVCAAPPPPAPRPAWFCPVGCWQGFAERNTNPIPHRHDLHSNSLPAAYFAVAGCLFAVPVAY